MITRKEFEKMAADQAAEREKNTKKRIEIYDGEYLIKDELEHGMYYNGICRDANVARWNEETEKFYYIKKQYGDWVVLTVKHPEDEEWYDVFYPKMKIVYDKPEIPFDQDYIDPWNEE